ncbi:MAG: SbcC/MukB-like Walker B domain-containing protein [Bacteroidales bacterium]|jgi:exonuclease SbcC|nr:SbcC/MukB-like Walker B domain-containing protein [Bacteroidales bacterium]
MKILNLKFKNINSLSGENEIDFTAPIFTQEGLFAITGKTGSGKSSILDAISLALYGKTPRVDITGTENAVMTRGEKDCYAEIVFEVAGKKWKSSWKQERARTGTLKQIERVIADENDQIVADKISIKGERKNEDEKTVNEKIIEILGLTFEQFTKVIMLAQGSFAAFLQANKAEKGELLEQITGTEIYGKVSQKVFEKNKEEKDKLEKIVLELGQIKILTEEEINQYKREISDIELVKKNHEAEIQKITNGIKWLQDLENLEQSILENQKKVPVLEERALKIKSEFEQAEIALQTSKKIWNEQMPVFKAVRDLETKLTIKQQLYESIIASLTNLELQKANISNTLQKGKEDLVKTEQVLVEKWEWAKQNVVFEELISRFAAIENEDEFLQNKRAEINKIKEELSNIQEGISLKKEQFEQTNQLFSTKNQALITKSKELESKKEELQKVLNQKDILTYQSEKEHIISSKNLIVSLLEIDKNTQNHQKEIFEIKKLIEESEIQEKKLLLKSNEIKKELSQGEEKIQLLEENIKLAQKIQLLEAHRKELKDGEACPLCGALDHPYAIGNIPEMGEKDTELRHLKSQIKELTFNLQEMEKKIAQLGSDKTNYLSNLSKEEYNLEGNQIKQSKLSSELQKLIPNLIISDKNRTFVLEEHLEQSQKEFDAINSTISLGLELEKTLKKLRDIEIPNLQKDKETLEKSKNIAETALKMAEQEWQTKKEFSQNLEDKYQVDHQLYLKKLEKYGVQTISALQKCLEQWTLNKKESDELQQKIVDLKNNITLYNSKLEEIHAQIDQKNGEKLNLETELQELQLERTQRFGNKIVDEEETRLKKEIDNHENHKIQIEQALTANKLELNGFLAVIKEKSKEYSEKKQLGITEKSKEELQTEHDEIRNSINELSQKVGGYDQLLKTNEENLKKSGKKLKEKEHQQQICIKWEKLNLLIGSADGKKYRNFAQALTFEHLIGISNKQLQKMSDRYILKRTNDVSNPFELSVIDQFQNNEERTAQNLSGGEKFIVSLSLALGLANMASKNMSIDTMFIDEGFGTLDSDYLDVALNALSNLQSEGKIIGVISHLNELKERIATHIEVVPSGNGHSKIRIG